MRILVVGQRHIHAAEVIDGVAHIAWSGRVPCDPSSGAFGVSADPQSINGDEPWIGPAAAAVESLDSSDDCDVRPALLSVGVPLL